jgi:hypothetical protein
MLSRLRIVYGKLRDRQKRSIERTNQEIDNNPNVTLPFGVEEGSLFNP